MEQASRTSSQHRSGPGCAAGGPRRGAGHGGRGRLRATTSAALALALAAATLGFTAARESADDAARPPGPPGGYAAEARGTLVLPVAIAGPTESTAALLLVRITTDPAVPADTLQALRGYVRQLLASLVQSAPDGAASYPEKIAMVRRAIEEAVPLSIAPLLPRDVRTTVGTSIALAEGWRAPAARPAETRGDAASSTRGPTPVRPPAATEEFHVQAGAFNHLEYARDLLHQLRAHGYRASLVEAADGPPHRVWVGPVPDRSSALHLAARLRADGFEAIPLPP